MNDSTVGVDDQRGLSTYTIYYQPELRPPYRVRRFAVVAGKALPQEVIGVGEDLESARQVIPPSADFCFPAELGDAPEIVETWI
ncbi:MAG: hypothetical protein ABWX96_21310 [Propionibacteriaceae bacterium]